MGNLGKRGIADQSHNDLFWDSSFGAGHGGLAAWLHSASGLAQESAVVGSPSSHLGAALHTGVAPSSMHSSPMVHGSPSSQVPVLGWWLHLPSATLHKSTVQVLASTQKSLLQVSAGLRQCFCTQIPPPQSIDVVQDRAHNPSMHRPLLSQMPEPVHVVEYQRRGPPVTQPAVTVTISNSQKMVRLVLIGGSQFLNDPKIFQGRDVAGHLARCRQFAQ